MTINGHSVNPQIAVYDGCHKIYIPAKGRENEFIDYFELNEWLWDEDFYKVNSVADLMNMYLDSCPLKFIQAVDASDMDNPLFVNIIPQNAFCDTEGFFDETAARRAFAD